MTDLNQVAIQGRIVKDATVREIKNGRIVCNFTLALNRSIKTNDEFVDKVSYIPVTYFCRADAKLPLSLIKGNQITAAGSLCQDTWENESGKHSLLYVLASQLFVNHPAKKSSEAESADFEESDVIDGGDSVYGDDIDDMELSDYES